MEIVKLFMREKLPVNLLLKLMILAGRLVRRNNLIQPISCDWQVEDRLYNLQLILIGLSDQPVRQMILHRTFVTEQDNPELPASTKILEYGRYHMYAQPPIIEQTIKDLLVEFTTGKLRQLHSPKYLIELREQNDFIVWEAQQTTTQLQQKRLQLQRMKEALSVMAS